MALLQHDRDKLAGDNEIANEVGVNDRFYGGNGNVVKITFAITVIKMYAHTLTFTKCILYTKLLPAIAQSIENTGISSKNRSPGKTQSFNAFGGQ